jgi:hypothetical protein
MCELYNRPAEIWAYDPVRGAQKLRTFHEAGGDGTLGVLGTLGNVGAQAMPALRLSYYGGGHYDSIVSAGHAASVLREEPGVAEDRLIELCKRRQQLEQLHRTSAAGHSGGSRGDQQGSLERELEQAAAASLSEAQRADQLQLQRAMEQSRAQYCDRQDDDLETCLLMSLRDRGTRCCALGAGGYGVSAGSGAEAGEGSDSAGDAAGVAIQDSLLRAIQQQSEQEYLEQAILQSSVLASNSDRQGPPYGGGGASKEEEAGGRYDAFDAAEQLQVEEEMLRIAMLASQQDTTTAGGASVAPGSEIHEQRTPHTAAAAAAAAANAAPRAGAGVGTSGAGYADASSRATDSLAHLTDDELLELALQQSMQQPSPASAVTVPAFPSSVPVTAATTTTAAAPSIAVPPIDSGGNNNQPTVQPTSVNSSEEQEREMLQRAIAASLVSSGSSGVCAVGGGDAGAYWGANGHGASYLLDEDSDEQLMRAIEESLRK